MLKVLLCGIVLAGFCLDRAAFAQTRLHANDAQRLAQKEADEIMKKNPRVKIVLIQKFRYSSLVLEGTDQAPEAERFSTWEEVLDEGKDADSIITLTQTGFIQPDGAIDGFVEVRSERKREVVVALPLPETSGSPNKNSEKEDAIKRLEAEDEKIKIEPVRITPAEEVELKKYYPDGVSYLKKVFKQHACPESLADYHELVRLVGKMHQQKNHEEFNPQVLGPHRHCSYLCDIKESIWGPFNGSAYTGSAFEDKTTGFFLEIGKEVSNYPHVSFPQAFYQMINAEPGVFEGTSPPLQHGSYRNGTGGDTPDLVSFSVAKNIYVFMFRYEGGINPRYLEGFTGAAFCFTPDFFKTIGVHNFWTVRERDAAIQKLEEKIKVLQTQ